MAADAAAESGDPGGGDARCSETAGDPAGPADTEAADAGAEGGTLPEHADASMTSDAMTMDALAQLRRGGIAVLSAGRHGCNSGTTLADFGSWVAAGAPDAPVRAPMVLGNVTLATASSPRRVEILSSPALTANELVGLNLQANRRRVWLHVVAGFDPSVGVPTQPPKPGSPPVRRNRAQGGGRARPESSALGYGSGGHIKSGDVTSATVPTKDSTTGRAENERFMEPANLGANVAISAERRTPIEPDGPPRRKGGEAARPLRGRTIRRGRRSVRRESIVSRMPE